MFTRDIFYFSALTTIFYDFIRLMFFDVTVISQHKLFPIEPTRAYIIVYLKNTAKMQTQLEHTLQRGRKTHIRSLIKIYTIIIICMEVPSTYLAI